MKTPPHTLNNDDIERLARKRAGAKLGWYIHAGVYLLVNLLLVSLSLNSGRHWALYPLLGWSLGLLIHGLVVFLRTDGAGLHAWLLQRERERLAPQRDLW